MAAVLITHTRRASEQICQIKRQSHTHTQARSDTHLLCGLLHTAVEDHSRRTFSWAAIFRISQNKHHKSKFAAFGALPLGHLSLNTPNPEELRKLVSAISQEASVIIVKADCNRSQELRNNMEAFLHANHQKSEATSSSCFKAAVVN